jgi:hypothetical protein
LGAAGAFIGANLLQSAFTGFFPLEIMLKKGGKCGCCCSDEEKK